MKKYRASASSKANHPRSPVHGVVLLFSFILLSLLVLLAIGFILISRTEFSMATTWRYQLQAKLLAESGLEQAVVEVRHLLRQNPYSIAQDFFVGEDLNKNGVLDPGEDRNGNGFLDVASLPLENSFASSFSRYQVQVGSQRYEVSGVLSAPFGLQYVTRLKVIDTSSQINIHDANPQLYRILDNLSVPLKAYPSSGTPAAWAGQPRLPSFPPSASSPQASGTSNSENSSASSPFPTASTAPSKIYVGGGNQNQTHPPQKPLPALQNDTGNREEETPVSSLYPVASPFLSENSPSVFQKVIPLLSKPPAFIVKTLADYTRRSLKASSLAGPTPAAQASSPFPDEYLLQDSFLSNFLTLASGSDPKVILPKPLSERPKKLALGSPIHSITDLYPGPLKLQERSPINLNTAPVEVLFAVLNGLTGVYIDAERLGPQTLPKTFDNLDRIALEKPVLGTLKSKTISEEKAMKVAQALVEERTRRHGFKSWNQLQYYLYSLEKSLNLDRVEADIILANANPNTDLNTFNPDAALFHRVDKSDLTTSTTEFSLSPTGIFEIEAVGWVLHNGEILADYKLKTLVRLYDLVRDSTEQDFSQGQISPAYPFSPLYQTYHNKSLELYPEPDLSRYPESAAYDGQIERRTLSLRPQKNMTFLDHFDQGLAPEVAQGQADLQGLNPDWLQSLGSETGTGRLFPEGLFVDTASHLSIPTRGNIPLTVIQPPPPSDDAEAVCNPTEPLPVRESIQLKSQASITFWIKPTYFYSTSQRAFPLFTILHRPHSQQYDLLSLYSFLDTQPFQLWREGAQGFNYFLYYGTSPLSLDLYSLPDPAFFRLQPNQWNYVNLTWNITYLSQPTVVFYLNHHRLTNLNSLRGRNDDFLSALPTFFNAPKTVLNLGRGVGESSPFEATFDEVSVSLDQKNPASPLSPPPRFYPGQAVFTKPLPKTPFSPSLAGQDIIAWMTVYNDNHGAVQLRIPGLQRQSCAAPDQKADSSDTKSDASEGITPVFCFAQPANRKPEKTAPPDKKESEKSAGEKKEELPLPVEAKPEALKYEIVFPEVSPSQVAHQSEIVDDVTFLIPTLPTYLKYITY